MRLTAVLPALLLLALAAPAAHAANPQPEPPTAPAVLHDLALAYARVAALPSVIKADEPFAKAVRSTMGLPRVGWEMIVYADLYATWKHDPTAENTDALKSFEWTTTAKGTDVAMEELTLAYEGIELKSYPKSADQTKIKELMPRVRNMRAWLAPHLDKHGDDPLQILIGL